MYTLVFSFTELYRLPEKTKRHPDEVCDRHPAHTSFENLYTILQYICFIIILFSCFMFSIMHLIVLFGQH